MNLKSLWNSGFAPQHSLGNVSSNSTKKDRNWNRGYLALGEVIKIHPKRYTADVQIFHTQDNLSSADSQEGKHACKIGVSSAGFNNTYQMPYGEILPIYRGDIVLVGFLKNVMEQPVILNVFHDISEGVGVPNYRNVLPMADSDIGDITEYLKITPIQDYLKIDELGNFEKVSHTKSFVVGTTEKLDEENFDFEDLSVKYPSDKSIVNPLAHIDTSYDNTGNTPLSSGDVSGKQLTVHVDEKYSKPKKYLAVFRDKFQDRLTSWLRFFLDSSKLSFKVFQSKRTTSGSDFFSSFLSDNSSTDSTAKKGTCTSIELDEKGTFKLIRQLDNYSPKAGDSGNSKLFTRIRMINDGGILIESIDNETTQESPSGETEHPSTVVYIAPKGGGVSIQTTSKLLVNAEQGIHMTSEDNITINSEKAIAITSKEGTVISSEDNIVTHSMKETQVISEESMFVLSQTNISMASNDKIDVTSGKIKKTGKMENYGSVKSVGNMTVTGNSKFVGSQKINGRKAVLKGDVDSHGYSNHATFADHMISVLQDFVVNVATETIKEKLSGISAFSGITQLGMENFTSYDVMAFNGYADDYTQSAHGQVIGESSPFYAGLLEFCEKKREEQQNDPFKGLLNLNSASIGTKIISPTNIYTQMYYMVTPKSEGGLGIDLSSKYDNSFEGTLEFALVAWEEFGKPNTIEKRVADVLALSHEFSFNSEERNAFKNSCFEMTTDVKANAFNQNIGEGHISELSDMVDVSKLITENQVHKSSTSYNPGDGGGTTTKFKYTVEDALDDVGVYVYVSGWANKVEEISTKIDNILGTNATQYSHINRKKTNSSTYQGGVTIEPEYTSEPEKIKTKDEFIDRMVKRFVLSNAIAVIGLLNNSWKYYVGNTDVLENLTPSKIQAQENQVAQMQTADTPTNT